MPDTLGSRIRELRWKNAPGATLGQLVEWGRKGDPSIGNLRAIAIRKLNHAGLLRTRSRSSPEPEGVGGLN